MELNARAAELCRQLLVDAEALRVSCQTSTCGTRLIDCGIQASGGLEAGCRLAEICLAGLAKVQLLPAAAEFATALAVMVTTDHPLEACMAAQYAGWQIAAGDFFAMGSGPMRAAAGRESLYDTIGCLEKPRQAVGVLESRKLPPEALCREVAEHCGVAPSDLTLLLAPTASLAGSVQVVARSVETALHKLHELNFDLHRVVSGTGVAPLPPASGGDLAAIGRTNDAILYGADVTLWVRGDDASLLAIGPRVPNAAASSDYGQRFRRDLRTL